MQKTSFIRSLLKGKLPALLLALTGGVLAVGVPAGTVIQNRAELIFTPSDGSEVKVPSNPVETVVRAVCSPSVLPNGTVALPGQAVTVVPGNKALFKYTLTNTGNARNTFGLTTPALAASQFTPKNTALYHDKNSNGQIDTGETTVKTLTLAADAKANLLLQAGTPDTAQGNAYLNVVATCNTNKTGASNETDQDNVSQIKLTKRPQFKLSKRFKPNKLLPGQETTVEISARNNGGVSREVAISDFLNTPDMRDFVFVSGSARLGGTTKAVLEYTTDGKTWQKGETKPVAGLRAKSSSMAAGGTLTLTFKLRAPQKEVGTRRNIAVLRSGKTKIEAPADVTVTFKKEIALGPIKNPRALPGGELSKDDRQVRDVALMDQEVCFAHTKQNLGELEDVLTTSAKVEVGQARVIFREMDGTQIKAPFAVTLAPQATKDFQACYIPSKTGGSATKEGLRVLLTTTSKLLAKQNQTIDIVKQVREPNMKLLKTSDKGEGKSIAPGEEISYTLNFTNQQKLALKNVVIRDDLKNIGPKGGQPDRSLEFISADQGGKLENGVVVWRFPQVGPGQTLKLNVKARVPKNVPEEYEVVNRFTVTSEKIKTPVPSNPTKNPVFDPEKLRFSKESRPKTVRIGEEITYIFKVKNESPKAALQRVTVEDTLPQGLKYVQGSSTLDGSSITPQVSGRKYTWMIPGLAAGATAEIRFRAVVTPNAPAQIRNNAIARGVKSDRKTRPVSGSATTRIRPLDFGPNNADLVGYVFLDRDRDGIYDHGFDVPCPNSRVILSNGRIALTDVEGRYHFRNVKEATWAVRLDPNSVFPQNLTIPQDAGRSGSRMVYVRNLTSVDFPLIPDGGDIAVVRDTTLKMRGGLPGALKKLSVRKQVFYHQKQGVYAVQLFLKSSATLKGLVLTDPLPKGATLASGQNNLKFETLPSGERMVSYTFRYGGGARKAVTDPTASWRYAE